MSSKYKPGNIGCAITYLKPSMRFLFTPVVLVKFSGFPPCLINNGAKTLIIAITVVNQNATAKLSPKEVTRKMKGVNIDPICQVIVFIATACPKIFLGTTLAVRADLAGLPNILVADKIPVITYICHISRIPIVSNIAIVPIRKKLKNCVIEIIFFLSNLSANTPPYRLAGILTASSINPRYAKVDPNPVRSYNQTPVMIIRRLMVNVAATPESHKSL